MALPLLDHEGFPLNRWMYGSASVRTVAISSACCLETVMVVLLTLGGLKPCGAETTATSGGGLKRRYLLEGRLNHGHNHELGDAHTGFYVKECCLGSSKRP